MIANGYVEKTVLVLMDSNVRYESYVLVRIIDLPSDRVIFWS